MAGERREIVELAEPAVDGRVRGEGGAGVVIGEAGDGQGAGARGIGDDQRVAAAADEHELGRRDRHG
jgi:hypothetical protein